MKTLLLLSIITIASSLPLDTDVDADTAILRNDLVEGIVLDLLEDFRDVMIHGSDTIPVLDPLHVETLEIDLEDIGLSESTLKLNNVEVKQGSTFVVNDLTLGTITTFPIQRWGLIFDIHIPQLDVEVEHYDLQATHEGYTIWGSGDARLSFIEPRLKGELVIRVRLLGGLFIFIENCDIKFSLKAFKSDINGLLDDENASNFINSVLEHLLPDLIAFYEEDISAFLNENVTEIVNEILADLNLEDILGRRQREPRKTLPTLI